MTSTSTMISYHSGILDNTYLNAWELEQRDGHLTQNSRKLVDPSEISNAIYIDRFFLTLSITGKELVK